MPEPTTDIKGRKTLPKWGYIAIGGGVLIAFIYYRNKKKKEESEPPTGNPYTNQSFIPVTGENVAGAGAMGGLGGGGFAPNPENEKAINALIESNKKYEEFVKEYIQGPGSGQKHDKENQPNQNPTGGGPPGEGQIGTGGGGGGGGGGTTPTPEIKPPPPLPLVPHCSAGWPNHNPKRGAPSCHSCYKDIKCGNGCLGHEYECDTPECQHKSGGKCVW